MAKSRESPDIVERRLYGCIQFLLWAAVLLYLVPLIVALIVWLVPGPELTWAVIVLGTGFAIPPAAALTALGLTVANRLHMSIHPAIAAFAGGLATLLIAAAVGTQLRVPTSLALLLAAVAAIGLVIARLAPRGARLAAYSLVTMAGVLFLFALGDVFVWGR